MNKEERKGMEVKVVKLKERADQKRKGRKVK